MNCKLLKFLAIMVFSGIAMSLSTVASARTYYDPCTGYSYHYHRCQPCYPRKRVIIISPRHRHRHRNCDGWGDSY